MNYCKGYKFKDFKDLEKFRLTGTGLVGLSSGGYRKENRYKVMLEVRRPNGKWGFYEPSDPPPKFWIYTLYTPENAEEAVCFGENIGGENHPDVIIGTPHAEFFDYGSELTVEEVESLKARWFDLSDVSMIYLDNLIVVSFNGKAVKNERCS